MRMTLMKNIIAEVLKCEVVIKLNLTSDVFINS